MQEVDYQRHREATEDLAAVLRQMEGSDCDSPSHFHGRCYTVIHLETMHYRLVICLHEKASKMKDVFHFWKNVFQNTPSLHSKVSPLV